MKVVALIGDHPRHRYVAKQLYERGYLSGLVVENREQHIPEPPSRLNSHLTELYTKHFELRAEAEKEFFGDPTLPDISKISVSREEINSDKVQSFLRDQSPDITVTYGVHILSDQTLDTIPGRAWNVHGGLSPEYKGVITHFWPSYMLEPQMTAVTLHELTSDVDAGAIVHQTGADLVRGDGIHQLASRTVRKFAHELPEVVSMAADNSLSSSVEQNSTGKLWVADDWRPEHLKVIYDKFNNNIVDLYLDGKFESNDPDLVRQFE